MAATYEDIKGWLDQAVAKGCTHLIVATDTFDWSDYPVYVMPDEDVRKKASEHQKVMEVYSMKISIELQLREHRAMHWE